MGESIMAASSDEDKMGETAASDRALEVSVSFGRFENDSLSWEKWSSFSQNKSNDQNGGDPIGKACGTDPESHIPNGQSQTSAEGTGQETKLDSLLGSGHIGEVDEDAAINVEGQGSLIERVEELASQEIKDSPEKLDKETQRIPVIKEENVKLDHWKEYQKTSAMSKIRDVTRIKKKPASPVSKSPQISTSKDKDIVKRAFKTFQNDFSQLKASAEERSLGAKQVLAKGTEVKVSNSMTPRKENAGSFKAANMDKKTAKAAPSSFGLKSDERAEKRKEFSKKLEEKSKAKEAESTCLQTKSKQEKELETRKLRQSLNFKATPMPGFYRGQKVSKSPLDKEGSKTLGI
ncbi:hypothetical protein GH714_027178 [Hevea brasiliensis]|uniref:TPX2 C-terminal domain-containing protein n=1 Tax=Hevea brasiliensis TaxID=3981 RepID=A0A6A6NJF6_HEVBR|nr:hypothetical protein GH714_027178 [Hevea brasiliensis]